MGTATLILIRHAESDHTADRLCGWCDAPLSPGGYKQVRALKKKMALDPAPDSAYTSTLTRARETSRLATDLYGIDPQPMDSLREISCGQLDGMPITELQNSFPDLWERNLQQRDDNFRWPGGESYREFRNRVLRTIRSIAKGNRGKRVLIFTHAGVIAQIVGFVHHISSARWELFRPGYASTTELLWCIPKPHLVCFDDRSYL